MPRRKPKVFAEDDHLLERLIDEEYTRHPFLRQPKNGGVPGPLWPHRQQQKGAAPDAHDGTVWHGSGTQHQPGAFLTQGVSVPAARYGHRQAQSSLEYEHHVHPAGTRVRLPGDDHRLVFPARAELADQL